MIKVSTITKETLRNKNSQVKKNKKENYGLMYECKTSRGKKQRPKQSGSMYKLFRSLKDYNS